ncbi:MAG: putative 2-aminoethylphosphonate ABC transporter ATP-binding protein [Synechococcaceae cyanobacterium SM2_3_2]|nr:putative 2-aminoethylphosphonate ABC transporter ATP-binding protein [Synechococcaceae cyanobacterium SM2_3_2]
MARELLQPQSSAPASGAETAVIQDPYLSIRQVSKSFGSFVALEGIDLEVNPGEFICLLGPSGCGKTTLLRIIAGLETPDSGQIWQDGRDITPLPPSRRDFGIVFQSYALFPNLTAEQNVAYGLVNAGIPKPERQRRVAELLELVGLTGIGGNYPAQLSGGQQQRIALARALALSPGLLLLDEPLSALDAQVRGSLRSEITQLQKCLGVTTVMVTHDQIEALTMADRVVVMAKGSIAQVGSPLSIYRDPANPFVAQFIGSMNFLPAEVTGSQRVLCGGVELMVNSLLETLRPGQSVQVAIRPEDIRLREQPGANTLTMQLQQQEFLGSFCRLHLLSEAGIPVLVDIPPEQWGQIPDGQHWIQLPAERIQVFEC